MAQVETLQRLVERRLADMGRRLGRDEPLTLREAWMTLPADEAGKRPVSYEIARRVAKGIHRNVSDRVADALATMLDVSVTEVLEAAGQRPRLGRFELPRRADRLTDRERRTVVEVVDVILEAGGDRQVGPLPEETAALVVMTYQERARLKTLRGDRYATRELVRRQQSRVAELEARLEAELERAAAK